MEIRRVDNYTSNNQRNLKFPVTKFVVRPGSMEVKVMILKFTRSGK